ncbi:DUF7619 domain-containing protein [Pontibacter beigongshangensis]|uniref:DUF7619 domain-containing protein n=1 Tax=Pontibacter beigongshangensis TaxID=2574733 RepID=UPI001650443D|nr:IPT/TIG domain-containing protein [Pontibacter beigongshangensis]
MRTGLLLFFLCLAYVSAIFAQTSNYTPAYIVGKSLLYPQDIVMGQDGLLYVADGHSTRVFDTSGNFKKEYYTKENIRDPRSDFRVSRDKDGNVYLITEPKGTIQKLSPSGEIILTIDTHDEVPYTPKGIVVDNDGNIFIAYSRKHKIQKFSPQGTLILEFGELGHQQGQFSVPTDLALDANGNLYVTDTGNKRIQVFNKEGKFIKQIGGQESFPDLIPSDVAVDAQGNVYVTDVAAYRVLVFDSNNRLVRSFGTEGWGDGQFMTGHFMEARLTIAVDATGNIFVGEGDEALRIQKFSPEGKHLLSFGYGNTFIQALPEALSGSVGLFKSDAIGNFFICHKHLGIINKYDKDGNLLFSFGGEGSDDGKFQYPIQDMATDREGNLFVMAGDYRGGDVQKFSSSGNFITRFATYAENNISNDTAPANPDQLALDHNGYIYLKDRRCIYKYNPQGNFVGRLFLNDNDTGSSLIFIDDKYTKFAFIAINNSGLIYTLLSDGKIVKHDLDGNFLGHLVDDKNVEIKATSIAFDGLDNIYITQRGRIIKYDPITKVMLGISSYHPFLIARDDNYHDGGISVNSSGSRAFVAGINSVVCFSDGTDPDQVASNQVSGTIFNDTNNNCLKDNEQGIAGMVVEALPGPFYGITDNSGNYSLEVGEGKFSIKQILPKKSVIREIEQVCPTAEGTHTVFFNSGGGTTGNINFANQATLSPYLSASVSSTRRRRCFPGTTTISYSNTGFASAANANVYLQLPEYVVLKSADKPYTRLPNGTYAFEAGTLAIGQKGTITIQDSVICGNESIRGLTVCTKAWITPGNQSAEGKATTTITGVCNYATGHIRFVIRNTGQADMDSESQFRIYQDGQLATVEGYQLAAGDSMVLHIPASGRTVRLEADQPDENGDNTLASATVEACREIASRIAVSTNFVNALPTDDEEAEVAEECLPIIDSYDPNDKLVLPTGLTEENYTPTNTPLKYKIRFQNTGTDVAYKVVVVDTLSQHLDIATLQMGAASHDYNFSVSGKGQPVLTWTFNNILLPDSTSNEPGSHGYIQFSIKPKAELPEKTAVENFADIFFDYNSPIRTNVTVNRIYDMPQEIIEENRIIAEEVIMTPAIANFTPAAGRFGAEVVITGAKFSGNAQDNKVYFNGIPAEVVEGDAVSLKVRVPAGASTGTLKVITANGGANSSAAFTVYQPPVVSGFSPAEGLVGSEVVLQGSHWSQELLEQVQLGSHTCEVIRTSENEIMVKVPVGAVSGAFIIHTKGGTAASSGLYKVWYAPAITSTDTAMQRVGGRVSLYGENFSREASRNLIQFGTTQAQVLQAGEQVLQVRVPEGAQTGTISVTTPGGTTSTAFEVIPAPLIITVHPARASVGTVVELKGQHFLTLGRQDTVSFSGMEAVILSSSASSFKVRVPRGAATGKVMVAGSGGRALADFELEPLTPQQAIEVYPNPSSGHITIDFVKADFDVQAVQVYDVRGRLVHDQLLNSGLSYKLEIDLSANAAGVYLVAIRTERGMVVKRIALL